MFTQIKMVMTLVMVMGLAGAGVYVMKLRADNATLKANQVKLETAVAEQTKVLDILLYRVNAYRVTQVVHV